MRLTLPPITPGDVARYMGLPGEGGSEELSRSIRGALALTEPLLKPVAAWGLYPVVDTGTDTITLSEPGGMSCVLPANSAFFRAVSHVQLSLITLGSELETLLARLYNEDPLTAMACDAAGSAALAGAGHLFAVRRKEALSQQGLEAAITYVPGCQGLPLTAQQGIFALLKPERLGVELSPACLMHPAKSATSVTPVAPTLPAWMKKVSPCQLCNLRQSCNFKATKVGFGT